MATFAVIDNGIIVNTILAASKEIAEDVTGLTCIEYDENSLFVSIGESVIDGKFGTSLESTPSTDTEAYLSTGAPALE